MKDKYIVFILCYKRPDKVYTLDTLKRCNYTGDWMLVLGNDDKTVDEYKNIYGNNHVFVFDKNDYSFVDKQDNFGRKNCVVYARNAVFDIAKKLGYKYFVMLDDDYTEFRFRYDKNGSLSSTYCIDADELFDCGFNLLTCSDKIQCVALAQTGDYIGGTNSSMIRLKTIRKLMNSYFCDVDRKVDFTGTINEDVNAYTTLATRGQLFLTIPNASVNQVDTQQISGGLTDVYLDLGTYIKSYYSVMSCPSGVKIGVMGDNHFRLHHKVMWNNVTPKILSDRYKK